MRHEINKCAFCSEDFCTNCSDANDSFEYCSSQCEDDYLDEEENSSYDPDDEYEGEDEF